MRATLDLVASMRPPGEAGGNSVRSTCTPPTSRGFNEAAGGSRRKRGGPSEYGDAHQRASMRPPGEAGGNAATAGRATTATARFNEAAGGSRRKPPPTFTGTSRPAQRFNEAAGGSRRKQSRAKALVLTYRGASMRPPGEAGGNVLHQRHGKRRPVGFNEAAGGSRRKPMRQASARGNR